MKAIREFSKNVNIGEDLEHSLTTFVENNSDDMHLKLLVDQLQDDLPPNLKEDLFYYRFGFLISEFDFFREIENKSIIYLIV